jgi:hypothetical protein
MLDPTQPGWLAILMQLVTSTNFYAFVCRICLFPVAVVICLFAWEVWLQGDAETLAGSIEALKAEVNELSLAIDNDANQTAALAAELHSVASTLGSRPKTELVLDQPGSGRMTREVPVSTAEIEDYMRARLQDLLARRSSAAERAAAAKSLKREKQALLTQLQAKKRRSELFLELIRQYRPWLGVFLFSGLGAFVWCALCWLLRVQRPYNKLLAQMAEKEKGLSPPSQ